MDEAWHALLLHPLLYVKICDCLLPSTVPAPRLFDHNPLGGAEPDREKRYRRTLGRYLETYDEVPPGEFWPSDESGVSVLGKRPRPAAELDSTGPITLVFKLFDFEVKSTTVKMPRTALFKDTFDAVFKSFGTKSKPRFEYRDGTRVTMLTDTKEPFEWSSFDTLTSTFQRILPTLTPNDYELEDGDQLDVLPKLVGC